MHRVRAFAWIRKHGAASGWRINHARNDDTPSGEVGRTHTMELRKAHFHKFLVCNAAISSVCEEAVEGEIDCDFEFTETDPISPADLVDGREAEINNLFTFHESHRQNATHRDLPVATIVPSSE